MDFYDKVFEVVKNTFKDWINGTDQIPYTLTFNLYSNDEKLLRQGCVLLKYNFKNKNVIPFTLNVMEEMNIQRPQYKPMLQFIQTYDIPANKYSLFIYLILDRIGQISFMHTFIQSDMVMEYASIDEFPQSIYNLLQPITKETNQLFKDILGCSLKYALYPSNMYADGFAKQHFKVIYDQVKEYIPGKES